MAAPRREQELRRELERLEERLAYNRRMRWEAPPRSRFAYAAHVTRLSSRIARLERDLAELERAGR
jgi:hypothetical protein